MPSEYEQQLERRRTFSAWLSRGATGRVEEEVALAGKGRHMDAIFSYLTGNRISKACRLAQKEGEEQLSAAEPQTTTDFKSFISLIQHKETGFMKI